MSIKLLSPSSSLPLLARNLLMMMMVRCVCLFSLLHIILQNQDCRTVNRSAICSAVSSVCVAGVDLPVAVKMKVLVIVLDWRLSFVKHVMVLARSCSYHTQAILDICHLLSRILQIHLCVVWYCRCSTTAIRYYMELWLAVSRHYSVCRIALQAPRRSHTRPLLRQLHCLPV